MLTRRRFFSESESIHCQPRQKQKRKAWNSGHSFFSHEKSFHDKRKQIFSGMFVKEIVNYHRPHAGTCSITTPLSLLAVSGACHCLAPPCGLQQRHGIGHPLHQGEIVPPVIVTKPVITTRGEGTSNGTTGNQGLPASCWKWRSLWKTQWDANSCHQQPTRSSGMAIICGVAENQCFFAHSYGQAGHSAIHHWPAINQWANPCDFSNRFSPWTEPYARCKINIPVADI